MSPQFVGPARLVRRRVEERAAVVGPLERVVDLVYDIREKLPGNEVLDVERERLRTCRVDQVRQQPVVGAHFGRPDLEVVVPLRELVLVQQHDLLGVQTSLLAAEDRVLLSLLCPVVVEEAVVEIGHGEVRFLDASYHLLVDGLLEFTDVSGHGGRVFILGLEVCRDLGVGSVPEPTVVVHPHVAEERVGHRYLPRDRWLRSLDRTRLGRCRAGLCRLCRKCRQSGHRKNGQRRNRSGRESGYRESCSASFHLIPPLCLKCFAASRVPAPRW